ncbi:MAG: Maf-like protein YhdE [Syntrophorhabdaceae bacterium PtaU1.Bin034]|jgi:septum formation protein|nr:MAG: Maf-like protein YhdE [Syntrophorhabdaceae bacterium PtaU1.Bin034]
MFQVKDENAIVLASESTRRIDIMRTLGVSFSIIPPDIDESRKPYESPKDYALRVAYEKAQKVGNLFPDKWIIGADTIVVLKGKVLGKPKTEKDAVSMLKRLRGNWHKVYTGYCVLNMSKQVIYQDVAETKVFIKDLTDEEIAKYIKTSEPFDKAGSYAVQGKGGYMVKEIKGSYTNVVGLPICEITEVLLSLGILS